MGRRKLPQLTSWEFNPTILQGLPLADLRGLYTQKRDIASKRLKRLQGVGFRSEQAEKYPEGIPKLKQIRASSEGDKEFEKSMLAVELSDLNRWLENRYTLVGELKKVRKKTLSTLHKHGYTWVTEQNFDEFTEFMNYLHATQLDMIYSKADSDTGYSESEEADLNAEKAKDLYEKYKELGGRLPIEVFMVK